MGVFASVMLHTVCVCAHDCVMRLACLHVQNHPLCLFLLTCAYISVHMHACVCTHAYVHETACARLPLVHPRPSTQINMRLLLWRLRLLASAPNCR